MPRSLAQIPGSDGPAQGNAAGKESERRTWEPTQMADMSKESQPLRSRVESPPPSVDDAGRRQQKNGPRRVQRRWSARCRHRPASALLLRTPLRAPASALVRIEGLPFVIHFSARQVPKIFLLRGFNYD